MIMLELHTPNGIVLKDCTDEEMVEMGLIPLRDLAKEVDELKATVDKNSTDIVDLKTQVIK